MYIVWCALFLILHVHHASQLTNRKFNRRCQSATQGTNISSRQAGVLPHYYEMLLGTVLSLFGQQVSHWQPLLCWVSKIAHHLSHNVNHIRPFYFVLMQDIYDYNVKTLSHLLAVNMWDVSNDTSILVLYGLDVLRLNSGNKQLQWLRKALTDSGQEGKSHLVW